MNFPIFTATDIQNSLADAQFQYNRYEYYRRNNARNDKSAQRAGERQSAGFASAVD